VGFALSAWACSLIQYFSIAQAGLIFLTGLFFLPKERRKAYWLSGIAAVVLFAPTQPIFYQQLFLSGSIGGWLSAPKFTFFTDFLQYTMNYSQLFMFATGIIILLPLILGKRSKLRQPLRWAGIAWFVIIFAIVFIYSLKREPILQHSTLIHAPCRHGKLRWSLPSSSLSVPPRSSWNAATSTLCTIKAMTRLPPR